MMKKMCKWAKIGVITGETKQGKIRIGYYFWVSEYNPYFEWYQRRNDVFVVVENAERLCTKRKCRVHGEVRT